ncbi:MAG: hypothetical protein ACFCBU_13525 [Cyanophyceae cyanobacterium]
MKSTIRFLSLGLGSSYITQIIRAIALVSHPVALSLSILCGLLMIAGGTAAIFRFKPSEWILDGTAILLGIIGGI